MLPTSKYKYLHFKPAYETPLVHGNDYFDISNSDLCRWNLSTFELLQCWPKITEAYYVKLRALSTNSLLLVENDTLKVFDTLTGKFTDEVHLEEFIEEIETLPEQRLMVCTVAGSDEIFKDVIKFRLTAEGRLEQLARVPADFADETYDAVFMLRLFPSERCFLYKKGADKIYEILFNEKEVRGHIIPSTTTALLELHNRKDFAVASEGKIDINDPSKSNFCGYIDCKDEIYTAVIQMGEQDMLITASNKAVKLWPMKENKAEPKIFAKSDRIVFDRLQINGKLLVGLSDKTKTIAVWDIATQEVVRMERLFKQELQRGIRLNEKHLCLVVKVFDETEETLSYHHKLEVLNIETDEVTRSRQIRKAGFNINVESVVRFDDESIRFICYSEGTEKPKEYLFTWKPELKEKDMTKVDLLMKAPITKLYPFDRIMFAVPPKEKVAVFNAFGKSECRTQLVICSHAMKRVGEIMLEGYYENLELAAEDHLYIIERDRTEIIAYQGGKFNRLRDIKISLLNIYPIGGCVLALDAQGGRRLYDTRFDELLVRADTETTEPVRQIVQVHPRKFLVLYKNHRIESWDVDKDEIQQSKLSLVVVDVTANQESLFVTQEDRIEVLDLRRVFE